MEDDVLDTLSRRLEEQLAVNEELLQQLSPGDASGMAGSAAGRVGRQPSAVRGLRAGGAADRVPVTNGVAGRAPCSLPSPRPPSPALHSCNLLGP